MRIGIATGLVVVGDLVGEGSAQEQAVVGETPNLAARLQALAQPGQIVLGAATRRLIGDLFRLRDLGRQTAKGFAEPVEAFAVEGVAVTESRFEAARRRLTDLVGRAAESSLLRERLRQAWAGAGQIVLLSGEAGIGKSRLAAQLAAEVASEPHTRLRYQCSPYHRDSVLHPFVVALGRAARLAPEDPAETQLDKLEAILAPARIAETVPLFASLLSIPTGERYPPLALSAAQQRRLTLAALLDQLEALARQKPVLMLFDDVHWADATSLEVLDLTVERVRARRRRRRRTADADRLRPRLSRRICKPQLFRLPRPGRERGLSARPTDGRGSTTTRARSGRRRVVRKTRSRRLRRDQSNGIERGHHGAGYGGGRERGERINRKLIAVTKGWPVRRRVGLYCR